MAGRFPLYTDADIRGHVVKALGNAGWDLVRAIDQFAEGEDDPVHFDRAVALGRVLVTNDNGQRERASAWYRDGRRFPGLIWWPQDHYKGRTAGEFLRAFEELAGKDDPFGLYPIIFLIAKRG